MQILNQNLFSLTTLIQSLVKTIEPKKPLPGARLYVWTWIVISYDCTYLPLTVRSQHHISLCFRHKSFLNFIDALACSTLTASEKVVVIAKQREGHTIAWTFFSNVLNWRGLLATNYIQTWDCVPWWQAYSQLN